MHGNYVNGQAIAGIVQIAQFALEFNSGKIAKLDPDGKITLEGGQVVRINDPNAVFSAGYKKHPFFTADDVNPSVTGKLPMMLCGFQKRADHSNSIQWLPYVCSTLRQR